VASTITVVQFVFHNTLSTISAFAENTHHNSSLHVTLSSHIIHNSRITIIWYIQYTSIPKSPLIILNKSRLFEHIFVQFQTHSCFKRCWQTISFPYAHDPTSRKNPVYTPARHAADQQLAWVSGTWLDVLFRKEVGLVPILGKEKDLPVLPRTSEVRSEWS